MKYDVIIIGSGPAGYVAAIRAGQLGLRTALVEKKEIGGMCLNWGCIPSKSMIESAKLFEKIHKDASSFGIDGIEKKKLSFNFAKATKRANTIVGKFTHAIESLLEKNAVEIIKGEAVIREDKSVSVNNRTLEADHLIIATGSKMPEVKSKHKDLLLDVPSLFKQKELPQNIVVLGNSATAIEISQFLAMIGKKVHLVAKEKNIMPLADEYLAKYMHKILKKNNINIHLEANIDNIDRDFKDGKLKLNGESLECDTIINAQNRKAVIPKHKLNIQYTQNNFIATDDDCQSDVDNVWAIGDVNGKSRFAHISSAQGMHVVNKIKGVGSKLDIKNYPLNMYTVPEIAQIGMTEDEIKKKKIEYKISKFPLTANGKAMTEGETEGFIRILSEKQFGEVLGVQIAATNATDLIAEASAFMQIESTVYDVAGTVHAHPTISEVFMEAGYEAIDSAIHK